MTVIEMQLGRQDPSYGVPRLDPGVDISIDGDHALAMEVLEHLMKFESSAGKIEVA